MNGDLAAACLDFSRLVQRRIGIKIRPDQHDGLGRFIQERTRALGMPSPMVYCSRLDEQSVYTDEFTRVICILTNPHTYFYRDTEQFVVLRQLGEGRRDLGRPLMVWCAGCATGEEPYSLAMYCLAHSVDVQVLGTDINPEAVAAAQSGRYRDWALRRLSDELRGRYLVRDGDAYVVGDQLRRCVEFRRHNLVGDPPLPPALSDSWDVIFCRNVFVYFDRKTVERVVRGFASVLGRSGLLVGGAAENLHGLDLPLEIAEVAGTLAYRKGSGGLPVQGAPLPAWNAGLEPPAAGSPTWTAPPPEKPAPPPPANGAPSAERLETDRADLAARLALANSHLRQHAFDAAIALYQEALQQSPLLAEAHYLLGVALRKVGDLERAARALQAALFLEPTLWCASFLLAGVERRLGRLVECRRDLCHTLRTLDEPGAERTFISFARGMQDVDLSRTEVEAVCRRWLLTLGTSIE